MKFNLSQNYPNPFNPETKIKYSLPGGDGIYSKVNLVVYDVTGRLVAVIVDMEQKSGTYEVNFNSNSLSSGIYFYKITAGKYTETKKMMLLK